MQPDTPATSATTVSSHVCDIHLRSILLRADGWLNGHPPRRASLPLSEKRSRKDSTTSLWLTDPTRDHSFHTQITCGLGRAKFYIRDGTETRQSLLER